jgi:hypothetical protein
MAARLRKWLGKEVTEAVKQNVAKAMGEFALTVEGNAKRELRRGHGVETGTLRRSIHAADAGYSWSNDDVEAGAGTPERGGMAVNATISGDKITSQVGSGLRYALPVHQGHGRFGGYHYLTNGLEKAKSQIQRIMKKYKL